MDGSLDPQGQQLVNFFISNGIAWVNDQRERHRPLAQTLTAGIRQRLDPIFSPTTLDRVRVLEVAEIENPAFYSVFAEHGQPLPLDFRKMAGITFGDTILIATRHQVPGESMESLMFHELVHVVQYSALGVDEFIRRYVLGWALSQFDYYRIPLEQDAYSLQAAFDEGVVLSHVESEILTRLGFNAPRH